MKLLILLTSFFVVSAFSADSYAAKKKKIKNSSEFFDFGKLSGLVHKQEANFRNTVLLVCPYSFQHFIRQREEAERHAKTLEEAPVA